MSKLNQAAGFENPLQKVFPQPIVSTRAPSASDRNYPLGQVWVKRDTAELFGLGKVEDGGATWTLMSPGASDVQSLTPDSGVSPVSPLGGTIDINGGDLITVTGSPNTVTLNTKPNGYPLTPYVVGPTSEAGYSTIQAAIDAAVGSGRPASAIWIQPGTYFENLDFSGVDTLGIGITLMGTCALGDEGQVEIAGTHIPPLTASLVLRNLKLTATAALFSSAAAGAAHLVVIDSEFNIMNGYAFDLLNWVGILEFFDTNPGQLEDGFINNTGGATVIAFAAGLGSGNANSMILSGPVSIGEVDINCPVTFMGTASLNSAVVQFGNPIGFEDAAAGVITYGQFSADGDPAITMNSSGNISLPQSIISSNHLTAVDGTGAGTLSLAGAVFTDQTAIAPTLTLGSGALTSHTISTLSFTEALTLDQNQINAEGSPADINVVISPKGSGTCEISSGNLSLSANGGTLEVVQGGATDAMGSATLAAGTITILNTSIAANDKIFLSYEGSGLTNTGALSYTITPATSFTIHSTNVADTNTVSYFIIKGL